LHHFSYNSSNRCGRSKTIIFQTKTNKKLLKKRMWTSAFIASIEISNIEKERTKNLNIEKIIDNVAKAKSRKDISYNRIS